MTDTLELAKQLIAMRSITPNDAGCQALMIAKLEAIGFTVERLRFGETENFWARRGTCSPVFAFAGHTDVVPTGPSSEWSSDPFIPEIRNGMLYGRGAADMKSSLAAMITACEDFIDQHPKHLGSIAFLITSDEEGPAHDGTVRVIEHLESRGEKIDWCLVGEPSSSKKVGDVIKNGRRGSLGARMVIQGQQGHVAYPHLALNPIHIATAALAEFCSVIWDQGNDHFPPTTMQISNINAGTGATNVIPGELVVDFNFRFSTEQTDQSLREQTEALFDRHDLNYHIDWQLSGHPFVTEVGALVDAVQQAIQSTTGFFAELSTSGGTSDGRFIAPTGAQVVELGPLNATIHQIDECVNITDIEMLSTIYLQTLENLLLEQT